MRKYACSLLSNKVGFTSVRLYTRRGESVTLKGHTAAVRSVNYSRNGYHLLTSSDDKTAKVMLVNVVLRQMF